MSDEDKTVIADISSLNLETAAPKKSNASLVQYSGAALGKRYPLTGQSVVVGRSIDADLTVPENSVSRNHAKLSMEGDDVYIEDLGSANGTFINNDKLSTRVGLRDKDMIRFGAVMFKFFSGDNLDGFIQDEIYRKATIDVGTQIYNKQYLLESLNATFNSAKSSGRPLSIIYYDLDHFKKVNDSYGHNAGDQVLKEGTQIVKNLVRKDDILGRFGGEEFVILLPNTDAETAYDLAERLRKACEDYIFNLEFSGPDGQIQKVAHKQTFSLGIAEIHPDMHEPKDLLEAADKKLYTSKKTGRNRVTI